MARNTLQALLVLFALSCRQIIVVNGLIPAIYVDMQGRVQIASDTDVVLSNTSVKGLLGNIAALNKGLAEEREKNRALTQQVRLLSLQKANKFSQGIANDDFGWAVAASGSMIVVGSHLDDVNGDDSGSAYVFESSTGQYVQTSKLVANDGDAGDHFGRAVAISGDTIVVGAWRHRTDRGSNSGAAYVFEKSKGFFMQKLVANDGAAGDNFGRSVAISDGTIVVGAWRHSTDESSSGAVYVFKMSTNGTFLPVDKLVPTDGTEGDQFGIAVAASGSTIVVGSHSTDDNGDNSGSAYIFEISDADQYVETKLLANDGAAGDEFGYFVAVSDDTIVVGAWGDDTDEGDNSGSAYVFEKNSSGYSQTDKLVASDGAAGDRFGCGAAVCGGTIVVGAYLDGSGSAYVYEKNSNGRHTQITKLLDNGGTANKFGYAVAVTERIVLVGAYGGGAIDPGSAFVFGL